MTVPPEALRLGMGPFTDPALFLDSGRESLALAKQLISLSPSDSVLDVGCGCGRVALPLREYLGPMGRYAGFDVDAACIAWCNEHIASGDQRFTFRHLDVASDSYNPDGTRGAATTSFPYPDRHFDCALLSSIVTHLEEAAIEQYVREVGRVLRPNGRALLSAFLLNEMSRTAIARGKTVFAFTHRIGPASSALDRTTPTEGIAVDEGWLQALLVRSGLRLERTVYGDWPRRRTWGAHHDWLAVSQG